MSITLTDVSKAYGANIIFNRYNCRFNEGVVTCVMGPSGQGKTTLLRMMMGLEAPDSGQISGVPTRMSAVFQEDRLCENLSAAANIRLVCRNSLKTSGITEAMSQVGLPSDCARQTVRNMSGGQRRRVAILRALAADYDILFMDEPFKGLDAETKELVVRYTKERTRGKTVICVTHDEVECAILGGKILTTTSAFAYV